MAEVFRLFLLLFLFLKYRGVAQLVAYQHGVLGAASSSLATPTLPAVAEQSSGEGGQIEKQKDKE